MPETKPPQNGSSMLPPHTTCWPISANGRNSIATYPPDPTKATCSPGRKRPGSILTSTSTGERKIDLFGDVAGTRLGRVKGAPDVVVMKGEDIAEALKVVQSEADQGVCKLINTMTGLTVAVTFPNAPLTATSSPAVSVLKAWRRAPGDLNVIISVIPDPAIEELG